MNINDNTLKAINVIPYNGKSINLNDLCLSHTNFKTGQILEAIIYGDMILIAPAFKESTKN